ncbi:hypothetical protein, partial [Marinobacter fuscus]|uniref:hypothetical protein n=1 Tax=Marinobacter fuscus TaxID=2109942 RepID=UPI00197FFA2E
LTLAAGARREERPLTAFVMGKSKSSRALFNCQTRHYAHDQKVLQYTFLGFIAFGTAVTV